MKSRLGDSLTRALDKRSGKDRVVSARKQAGQPGLFTRMAGLYAAMEQAYNTCAATAGLSCTGCTSNCCTSFFKHHTYVEWAYLWRGLHELDEARRKDLVARAKAYVADVRSAMAKGLVPFVMCPLNGDGLCLLYAHRLMICRMHGTRNVFTLPDGSTRTFPGCVRFTALPCATDEAACPSLDRTPFYSELAGLEMDFLKKAKKPMPRVDITIAEMIILGPPKLR
ncbi:hypothetical protein LJC09_05325 [Desulfovibrio sp. OttesenSCG-928-F20]|nr:hypothetical protein [Desulfovibrio sp. OttesenSCG-928-F20]